MLYVLYVSSDRIEYFVPMITRRKFLLRVWKREKFAEFFFFFLEESVRGGKKDRIGRDKTLGEVEFAIAEKERRNFIVWMKNKLPIKVSRENIEQRIVYILYLERNRDYTSIS